MSDAGASAPKSTDAAAGKPVVAGATNTTAGSVKEGASARLGKPWKVSDELLSFIGIWENGVENGKNFANQTVTDGFILTVYNDSRKLPTVGCGHLVLAADKLKLGEKITKERAQAFLKKDLAEAESTVDRKTKVPLFQYEYDALVSITFNAGMGGVGKLIDSVNTGAYDTIPAMIEKYRTGGGNTKRRKSEANVFKSGVYDATH